MSDHDLIKYTSLLGVWVILLVLAVTVNPDKIIARYSVPAPPPKLKFVPKPPSCCGDSICLMMHHHGGMQ